jgi:hypothetical protein
MTVIVQKTNQHHPLHYILLEFNDLDFFAGNYLQ